MQEIVVYGHIKNIQAGGKFVIVVQRIAFPKHTRRNSGKMTT